MKFSNIARKTICKVVYTPQNPPVVGEKEDVELTQISSQANGKSLGRNQNRK